MRVNAAAQKAKRASNKLEQLNDEQEQIHADTQTAGQAHNDSAGRDWV